MAGESILIVDDSALNLKLARASLVTEGYVVQTASNAEEALTVLKSFSPKLILMDIQLPGMDGLELMRRLKADPLRKDIVIIAFTAYAMTGDEQKMIAGGCDGYIAKPSAPDTLRTLIAKYLAERSC